MYLSLNLSEHIEITSTKDKITSLISNIECWKKWSPWLYLDPKANVVITGEAKIPGHAQTWSGDLIGSGKMTLTALDNHHIYFDLEFYKPFKSKARVVFKIEGGDKGCVVTWSMTSGLPFFLFFLKKQMSAYIKQDFGRGLKMLRDLAQKGEILSRSEYVPVKECAGFFMVGIKFSCSITAMPQEMGKQFGYLQKCMSEGLLDKPLGYLSLVEKFDPANDVCTIAAAAYYEKRPSKTEGFYIREVGSHKAVGMHHFGSYEHLGNSWAKLSCLIRHKKMKLKKKFPMYEIYRSMPGEVEEAMVHTEILAPIA
jgi:hypothetical protein